ncbi:hypothetical protein DASC09_044060 [Saccharomycopsis crataegensis]|uniref:ATPase expression protein 1 n=1 Tax=Saccharomycopsis crataegensis TaxID=43959 RepID=A0AAV5QR72_9ASCO|nr:hypothetical protein DASC09_044060 [Saccharomycopsis crataegensis]
MSKSKQIFGDLKNIANSKIPLVYKTSPQNLFNNAKVPKPLDIVHPYLKISDVEMVVNAMSSERFPMGLKVPVRSEQGKFENVFVGKYEIKPLRFTSNTTNKINWMRGVNESSEFQNIETSRRLTDDDVVVVGETLVNEESKQAISEFYQKIGPAVTVEQFQQFLLKDLKLNITSDKINQNALQLIRSSPAEYNTVIALISLSKNLLQDQASAHSVAISTYYSSLFVSELSTKIQKVYRQWPIKQSKAVIKAFSELVDVLANASQGFHSGYSMNLLSQLFSVHTKLYDLKKAQIYLNILLKNQFLPTESSFTEYVVKSCLDQRCYKYLAGLKNLLLRSANYKIIKALASHSSNLEELQSLLVFIDQVPNEETKNSIYLHCSSFLLKKAAKLAKTAEKLQNITVRVQQHNFPISADACEAIVSSFIQTKGFIFAAHYLQKFSIDSKNALEKFLNQTTQLEVNSDLKEQFINILKNKISSIA